MLKKSLESLEGLDESLHSYYEETEKGFRLKLDGDEEDRYKQKHQEAEKHRKAAEKLAQESQARLKEIEDRLAAEEEEKAKGKAKETNDWESYEKSLREQHAKQLAKLQDEKDKLIQSQASQIRSMTIGTSASDIANRLAIDADAAENIRDYIASKLTVDTSGEKPKTVVLDADGNPSALTLEEFEAEIKEMRRFQHLISGSKATGGGAPGGGSKGGGAPLSKPLKDMSPADKAAFITEHGLDAFQSRITKGN